MTADLESLQLIGINDAAAVLGISANTLRQWVCYGRFPYVKVGRRTMVAVQDLAAFVEHNRIAPSPSEFLAPGPGPGKAQT